MSGERGADERRWNMRARRCAVRQSEEAMFPFLMLGALTAHRSPFIRSQVQRYCTNFALCEIERDSAR